LVIPNRPAYKSNIRETKELPKQIEELIKELPKQIEELIKEAHSREHKFMCCSCTFNT
jgi:hypothetical protein